MARPRLHLHGGDRDHDLLRANVTRAPASYILQQLAGLFSLQFYPKTAHTHVRLMKT